MNSTFLNRIFFHLKMKKPVDLGEKLERVLSSTANHEQHQTALRYQQLAFEKILREKRA